MVSLASYVRRTGPLARVVERRREELIAAGKLKPEIVVTTYIEHKAERQKPIEFIEVPNPEPRKPVIRRLIDDFDKKKMVVKDNDIIEEFPTVRLIREVVCEHYGLDYIEFLSSRRPNRLAIPRQVAMYLARKLTLNSLPQIGMKLGGRDHTTVLHGIRKIDAMRATDKELSDVIDALAETIKLRMSGDAHEAEPQEGVRG